MTLPVRLLPPLTVLAAFAAVGCEIQRDAASPGAGPAPASAPAAADTRPRQANLRPSAPDLRRSREPEPVVLPRSDRPREWTATVDELLAHVERLDAWVAAIPEAVTVAEADFLRARNEANAWLHAERLLREAGDLPPSATAASDLTPYEFVVIDRTQGDSRAIVPTLKQVVDADLRRRFLPGHADELTAAAAVLREAAARPGIADGPLPESVAAALLTRLRLRPREFAVTFEQLDALLGDCPLCDRLRLLDDAKITKGRRSRHDRVRADVDGSLSATDRFSLWEMGYARRGPTSRDLPPVGDLSPIDRLRRERLRRRYGLELERPKSRDLTIPVTPLADGERPPVEVLGTIERGAGIARAAVSPDRSLLAVVGRDGSGGLYALPSLELLATFTVEGRASLAFWPDGATLVLADQSRQITRIGRDGTVLRPIGLPQPAALILPSAGHLLVAMKNGPTVLINPAGEVVATLAGVSPGFATALPDDLLLTQGAGVATLVDARTLKPLQRTPLSLSTIRVFAAGTPPGLLLWGDYSSELIPLTATADRTGTTGWQMSPDGRFLLDESTPELLTGDGRLIGTMLPLYADGVWIGDHLRLGPGHPRGQAFLLDPSVPAITTWPWPGGEFDELFYQPLPGSGHALYRVGDGQPRYRYQVLRLPNATARYASGPPLPAVNQR